MLGPLPLEGLGEVFGVDSLLVTQGHLREESLKAKKEVVFGLGDEGRWMIDAIELSDGLCTQRGNCRKMRLSSGVW